jgi:glycosyltransferase involved in cell wall biosynthesis
MRILQIVLHARPLGGLEIYGRDIGLSLKRLGHDVTVWGALEQPQTYTGWEDIPIRPLAPRNPLLCRFYFRRWRQALVWQLRRAKNQFDRILIMHPYAALSAHQAGISRYMTWIYGLEVWGKPPAWVQQGLQHSNPIISISTYTRDQVKKYLPTSHIAILRPAVDTQRFTPTQPLRPPTPPYRLLTVGRLASLEQYKGHEMVIRNLAAIHQRVAAPLEYWIVGDGDDRHRLEQIVRDVNLTNQVKFFGRVSDQALVSAYQDCDVFVMPSKVEQLPDGTWTGEGFGIVYLEASACGKPVVGSNTGGVTDAIEHGVTGFCTDPYSGEDFVNAVTKLLLDTALAQKMGRAGRLRAERDFSLPALDRNLEQILRGN